MEELVKDKESVRHFFSQHPLFQCIAADKETFAELLKKVRLAHYSKSEYLYKHGEKSKYVYLVQDGEIHITHRVENSQQTSLIGVQRHGSFFGEVSLISGQSHTADAAASLDSRVFLIPGSLFMKLLQTQAGIASHVAQILSARLYQNLSKETQEKPAKVFVLLYPEMPERGSRLCDRITLALNQESSGPVLLIAANEYSSYNKQKDTITLSSILSRGAKSTKELLKTARRPGGFSVVVSKEVYDPNANQNAAARDLPALLGRLRKHYSRILVDAGKNFESPIVTAVLSQCDHIILVRNANADGDSKDVQTWRKTVAHATNCVKNFFDRVLVISDNCTARGGRSARPVNTYSALYKNHYHLDTVTGVPLSENKEKEFVRALYRIVRKLSGTSRGLALGGGGTRALAHIGVFDVLEHEGIDFDAVAGTSMGAVVGALYAMGKDHAAMTRIFKATLPSSKNILDKTWPLVSFFRGNRLNRNILKIFSRIRFEDLQIAFYCNSSDLVSGQSIVFEKGYIATAIRASVSVPVAFPPLEMGPYRLIDGGVLNNMPGSILRNKGFHKIIGINVSNIRDDVSTLVHVRDRKGGIWRKIRDYLGAPPIINIANRAIEIQGNALMRVHEKNFDYIFYPDVKDFHLLYDFNKADAIIDKGREAALANLKQIKAALYGGSL